MSWAFLCLAGCSTGHGGVAHTIRFSGGGEDLQHAIDTAPPGAIILCDGREQLELGTPLVISTALTLTGLKARLPHALGKKALIVVEAEGVTLTDLELHGNYDSVDQANRAPLIRIHRGDFRLERCTFYDSSKDGVEISPHSGGADIVGGTIRDIRAFRIGRDAVSISGGNEGLRVREVTVEDVRLEKGYLRGAVEVSDGTDNIKVRRIYAEDSPYAIDVQDHRGRSAANTNIDIADVTAVNCRHIIRTANSPRGHANLKLRNLKGIHCEAPVKISHTNGVTISELKVLEHRSRKHTPITVQDCQNVAVEDVIVESMHFAAQPLEMTGCVQTQVARVKGLMPSPQE